MSAETECAVCLIEGRPCTYHATLAFRDKLAAERSPQGEDTIQTHESMWLFAPVDVMPGQTGMEL